MYNWVKNQRNYMRQYEASLSSSFQKEFKDKPMIKNSAYYYLLKDVLELKVPRGQGMNAMNVMFGSGVLYVGIICYNML